MNLRLDFRSSTSETSHASSEFFLSVMKCKMINDELSKMLVSFLSFTD